MSKNKHISPAAAAAACVSAPADQFRVPLAPAAWIVIVVVCAYALLAALGVSQAVALAGLAGAGALGVRLVARLAQVAAGGGRG